MNSTKTRSSLSTVSLAPPHTHHTYNIHCFFFFIRKFSYNSTGVRLGGKKVFSHLLPLARLGEQHNVVEGPKMCCTLSLSTPIYVMYVYLFLAVRVSLLSHSPLPRTFTQSLTGEPKPGGFCHHCVADGCHRAVDMKWSNERRRVVKLTGICWPQNVVRMQVYEESWGWGWGREGRGWGCGFYSWLRTVESPPSARYVLLLKKIMRARNRCSIPLRSDCEI